MTLFSYIRRLSRWFDPDGRRLFRVRRVVPRKRQRFSRSGLFGRRGEAFARKAVRTQVLTTPEPRNLIGQWKRSPGTRSRSS